MILLKLLLGIFFLHISLGSAFRWSSCFGCSGKDESVEIQEVKKAREELNVSFFLLNSIQDVVLGSC